jgi:oligopeptide/dipeptide ABC transporter ATP-binding protein
MAEAKPLLEVEDLVIRYVTDDGIVEAVNGVSLSIYEKHTLGLVGETGAGKTTLARGVMGLVPKPPGEIRGGKIFFSGKDLLKAGEARMRSIRGREISMIFQDPMTSLDPVFTIGQQIQELLDAHFRLTKSESRRKTIEALSLVGIPDPDRRLAAYPHEFSGGMRQRVMIAMALICSPSLIIADEPTTALDVTVQAQVLSLLHGLQKRINTAVILITHNLGIVWKMCETVMVMYAGKTVEYASTRDLYQKTLHPYTWGLLKSIPSLNVPSDQKLAIIPGAPPDLRAEQRGCNFAERCPYAQDICRSEQPPLLEAAPDHFAACHFQKGEGGIRFDRRMA